MTIKGTKNYRTESQFSRLPVPGTFSNGSDLLLLQPLARSLVLTCTWRVISQEIAVHHAYAASTSRNCPAMVFDYDLYTRDTCRLISLIFVDASLILAATIHVKWNRLFKSTKFKDKIVHHNNVYFFFQIFFSLYYF